MQFITRIRMSGGSSHEHIAAVQWHTLTTSGKGPSEVVTVKTVIDWIENKKLSVFVVVGGAFVPVLIVDHKYIRTKANDKWTDNLLSLPTF